jgi:uncharacterized protein (UPF0276 family)
LPYLGAGIGFRPELARAIFNAPKEIDLVEVITDRYFDPNSSEWAELERVCEAFTVVPHGVALSIGSIAPLDRRYLDAIKRVSDMTRAPYYTEHLCMTRAPGVDVGHLAPISLDRKSLRRLIDRVQEVQNHLGKPLVLENVATLFTLGCNTLEEPDFFQHLTDATGCGLLLDLANLYQNSVNQGFDAVAMLDRLPLERVVQVHLAGGSWHDDLLVDSHSHRVQEETWALLASVAVRVSVRAAILERDANFPRRTVELFRQVARARDIIGGRSAREGGRQWPKRERRSQLTKTTGSSSRSWS